LLSDSAKFDVPAFLWCRPPSEKASGGTRKKAEKDHKSGQTARVTAEEGATKCGKISLKAMKIEPKNTICHAALSPKD
jgi:hypothetical protein